MGNLEAKLLTEVQKLKESVQTRDRIIVTLTERLERSDFAVRMYDSLLSDALNTHIEAHATAQSDKYYEEISCMTTEKDKKQQELILTIKLNSSTLREFSMPYNERVFGQAVLSDDERFLELFYIYKDALPVTRHVIPATKEFFSEYLKFDVDVREFESYADFLESIHG